MNENNGKVSGGFTVSIASAIIVVLFVVIGVYAMFFGVNYDLFDDPIADVLDYYHCLNCNTIVPCPYNRNRIERLCPSCELRMNIVSKNIAATQNITGLNAHVAGGFGQGLGSGGNLVCPSCWLAIPHQRGVAAYSVNCPRCGNIMRRQLPAYLATAFYNNMNEGMNIQGRNQAYAPPITSNAVMPHEYRGVCSRCHQIVDLGSQSGSFQTGGNSLNGVTRPYRIGPGGSIIR